VSVPTHEPATAPAAGVRIECAPCGLSFDPVSGPGEAEHLAGVHNQLHHGGRAEATAVPVDVDVHDLSVAPVPGWVVAPDIYADAVDQSVPFRGDSSAVDRAWSVRVDEAVQAMDVLDPVGLDAWIGEHAESPLPHLVEAGLVGVWETWLRAEYAPDSLGEVAELADLAANAAITDTTALVDDVFDADGWD
jgi:hypothetical protein